MYLQAQENSKGEIAREEIVFLLIGVYSSMCTIEPVTCMEIQLATLAVVPSK